MRQTPLYERHQAAGGRMVDFAGWSLPVQYPTGIAAEHAAVREGVGVFDVSHMGEVEFIGPAAIAAADRLMTNDLSRLQDGQACYTAMCRPDGGILDDLVVYRLGPTHLLVCCNASNAAKDFAWMAEQTAAAGGLGPVEVVDRSAAYAQLAVQGPHAERALAAITEIAEGAPPLGAVRRYHFTRGQVAGVDAIISRTGYTGEDGFELYLPADGAAAVWDATVSQGAVPCGLGARDTLRMEMKYALYGNDIDESTSPLEAGLGWITRLDKADFIGRDALAAQKAAGIARRLVAILMDGPVIARHGQPIIDSEGATVGHITSGTRSPTLGRSIALGYVPTGQHQPGRAVRVSIRDRVQTGLIVQPPFILRPNP